MPAAMLLSALPWREKIEDLLCMANCDWPIPSLSISLRNCTVDKVSLSIAMAKKKKESLEHLFVKCKEAKRFWPWIFRGFNFNTELNANFIYLNNFESMTKLNFIISVLGKLTIWELRGILRETQIINLVNSLQIKFSYKLQSHVRTLYYRYKVGKNSVHHFWWRILNAQQNRKTWKPT